METEVYYEAAEIMRKAKEKKATLKTLIYASQYKNIRQLFALVNECVKYRSQLEEVLSACPSNFMEEEIVGGSKETALVLLYEHLLGRKFGRAASLRRLFHGYKGAIKSAVDKVLKEHNVQTLQEAVQPDSRGTNLKIPRYMRVNLIKSSVENAIEDLKADGWEYIGQLDGGNFKDGVLSLNKYQFGLDPFLFDLLVFPVGTDLHSHKLTQTGVLVQQDRASCIPAHALSPPSGSVVLDCCAAPGNKTSHLASLMKDIGQVIALDRDFKRMTTMSRLLERSGATCVELIHQDFLTVQPNSDDAENINMILVDPSCSGSGMLGAQTGQDVQVSDDTRIQTLKRFQISILKHALRFPNVERVAYSTCSIHQEENEQVVEEVMSQVSDYFQFLPLFPKWHCGRGLAGFPHADCFLRLSPQQDLTQGFFVACFERVKKREKKIAEIGNSDVDACLQRNFDDESEENGDLCLSQNSKSMALGEESENPYSVGEEHLENQRVSREGTVKKKKDSVSNRSTCILKQNESESFVTMDDNSSKKKHKKKKKNSAAVDGDSDVILQNNCTTDKTKSKKQKKEKQISETGISIQPDLSTATHFEEIETKVVKKRKHKDKLGEERGDIDSNTNSSKPKAKKRKDKNRTGTEGPSVISQPELKKNKTKDLSITDEDGIVSREKEKKKKRKNKDVDGDTKISEKKAKKKRRKNLSITEDDFSISTPEPRKKKEKKN